MFAYTEQDFSLIVPYRSEQFDEVRLRRCLIATLDRKGPALEISEANACNFVDVFAVLIETICQLGPLIYHRFGLSIGISLANINWRFSFRDRTIKFFVANVINRVNARTVEPAD